MLNHAPLRTLATLLLAGAALAGPPTRLAELGTPVENTQAKGAANFIGAVAFTADGKTLFAGRVDGTLLIDDVATGKETASIKAHGDAILTILRLGDKTMLTAPYDGQVKAWSPTGKLLRTVIKLSEQGGIFAMAMSNSQKKLALGLNTSDRRRLAIVDVASGRITKRLAGARVTWQRAFAPDDLTLLLAGSEVLQMWNLQANRLLWQKGKLLNDGWVANHDPSFSGCAFSADQTLAAASIDRQILAILLIWDAKTGKSRATVRTRSGYAHFVFSPDSQWIALGGSQPEVVIYDANTGKLAHDLKPVSSRVTSIAYSPDGSLLATGHWTGVVTIWDTAKLVDQAP